jgi:YD repeat-containing protein
MRPAVALIALLALSLAVPAAAAAARGERAQARALEEATQRLRASLPHDRRRAGRVLTRLYRSSRCARALEEVPAGPASKALFASTLAYANTVALHPHRDELAAFLARLQRIELRSRVLRSGRAALRHRIRAIRELPQPPADYCRQVEAWRRAGFPPEGAPTLHEHPAWRELDRAYDADGRRIARAGRVLRRHGAPRRIQRLWGRSLTAPVV